MVRRVAVTAFGAAAGALGAAGVMLGAAARGRRSQRATADLWAQATSSVADRDLVPPTTVSVNSARRPER